MAFHVAQLFKIAAGLAQAAFGAILLFRAPRTRVNVAFAIAFALNGAAFVVWNLQLPGARSAGSFALEGRGAFNWGAAVAMAAFAIFFIRHAPRRTTAWVLALIVITPLLFSYGAEHIRYSLGALAFGQTALAMTTAFALAVFPFLFATNSDTQLREACALFAAALAINAVDHVGAGLVRPSPYSVSHIVIETTTMTLLTAVWLWNARAPRSESASLSLLPVFFFVAPSLTGVGVRLAVGSYRGVQASGLIGLGRFVAVGVLAYGMTARGLFRDGPSVPRAPAADAHHAAAHTSASAASTVP